MTDTIQPPTFTANGHYEVNTTAQKLAAAVSALRSVAVCAQAYHSQGPSVIAANMEDTARRILRDLGVSV